MGKKVFRYMTLYCALLLLSGCSLIKQDMPTAAVIAEVTPIEKTEETPDQREITNEEMKRFFTQYLTISEEDILLLNQNPTMVNEEYWEAYQTYQTRTNEILGAYLSEDMKKELNKQYAHDDFHYPRFLEINDLFITGISSVDNAEVVSRQIQNNKNIYEIMITATAKVINLEAATKIYQWDENKGYYTKNPISETSPNRQEDTIKITLNYWVEVGEGESLIINSVKEKTNINLGIGQQARAQNNSFVSRISYFDQVSISEKEKIYKFLDTFMKQEYNFYHYYRQAHHTSYDALAIALKDDLRLQGILTLREDNYQTYFNPSIIPLKDNIDFIQFELNDDVTVTPDVSSSLNQPSYEVVVKMDVTLTNGEMVPYEYTYLFVFDNNMISAVRFIAKNKIEA